MLVGQPGMDKKWQENLVPLTELNLLKVGLFQKVFSFQLD